MEAALKKVQLLQQCLLPDRPYSLSLSPTARYQIPDYDDDELDFQPLDNGARRQPPAASSPKHNDRARASAARHPRPPPEEWVVRPLQYSTFVGDADRGVLFTRPYYDMREAPATSTATTTTTALSPSDTPTPNAAGGGTPRQTGGDGAAARKTKLSLTDYKRKKTSADSPPETSTAPGAVSGPRATVSPAPAAAVSGATPAKNEPAGSKPGPDRDMNRNGGQADLYGRRTRDDARMRGGDDMDEDRRKRPPPHSSDAGRRRSPTPERRRRPDADDELRGPRRSRADSDRTSQGDVRNGDATSQQDRRTVKDSKRDLTPSGTNGRAVLSSLNKAHTPSPKLTGLGINGHRRVLSSGSNSTPKKTEHATSAPGVGVPPLLSPLRLGIDSSDEDAPLRRKDRKSSESKGHVRNVSQSSQKLGPPATITKQKAVAASIPPLLSPTLPALIEEELARQEATLKLAISKTDDLRDGKMDRDSPSLERKAQERSHRKESVIVVLRYKKKNAWRVQKLLQLPKRTSSQDPSPSPSHGAQKRPAKAEPEERAPPSKKPRPSSEVAAAPLSKPARPSTPVKATAMSRIASNNSQARTPGDRASMTPTANPPPAERPSTSHEASQPEGGSRSHAPAPPPLDPAMQARLSSLRRRYEEYRRLGVKLKHDRDDLIRRASRMATNDVSTPGSHSTSNSGGQIATAGNTSSSGGSSSGSRPSLTTQELKQSVAIGLESIMAFVLAFRLMAEARSIESKVQDVNSWESLIPHLGILRNETKVGSSSSSSDNQLSRREMAMQIPHALASYLHAIVVDEAIQAVTTLADTGASGSGAATNGTGSNSGEYSGPAAVARLVRYTKQRSSTWRLARTAAERLVPPPPPAGTVGDHSHGNNGNGNGVSQQLTGPQLALRERTRARLERIGPWMHADEAVALTHKVLRAWAAEEGVEGWEAELAL